MTAKYWIKLYHETLHDPKMGRMSDHLYRRCIELFLMAGESDKSGLLPSVDDMAWTLRADPDALAQDMHALADANIVHWTEDGWVVTHFAERQEADTDAERMRQLRKRKRHAEYTSDAPVTDSYEPVTSRNTDKIREDKIREDIDKSREENKPPAPPPASEVYLNTQAVMTYRRVFGVNPNEQQARKMTAKALNHEVWEKACEHWRDHDWKPSNIPGLFEIYDNGGVCKRCANSRASPNGKRDLTDEEKRNEMLKQFPPFKAGDPR